MRLATRQGQSRRPGVPDFAVPSNRRAPSPATTLPRPPKRRRRSFTPWPIAAWWRIGRSILESNGAFGPTNWNRPACPGATPRLRRSSRSGTSFVARPERRQPKWPPRPGSPTSAKPWRRGPLAGRSSLGQLTISLLDHGSISPPADRQSFWTADFLTRPALPGPRFSLLSRFSNLARKFSLSERA